MKMKIIKILLLFFSLFVFSCSYRENNLNENNTQTVQPPDWSDKCLSSDKKIPKNFTLVELSYYKAVKEKILSNLSLPDKYFDEKFETIIVLEIKADGSVARMALEKTSESEEFNSLVIKAINNSIPFQKIPDSMNMECIHLGLRFVPGENIK